MSFFKLDDTNISYNNNIKYIYKDVTINKRDVEEQTNDNLHNSVKKENKVEVEGKLIPIKDTFYKINFHNKEANFIYTNLTPSSYIANNIYLYSVLHHNISGVTTNNKEIIGEIVIEHSNPNKQNQKVYTCFLINEELIKTSDNSIDKIINLVEGKSDYNELSVAIKNDIPTQTHCFHYEDNNNHVFVYTNPISVKKNAASFFKNKLASKTKLFNIYPAHDDKIVSHQLIKLGEKEGFVSKTTTFQENFQEAADGEVYIDCQPAGESIEEIQAQVVPLNGAYTQSKNKIDVFKTIIHLLVFIILAIVSVFGTSALYKTLIIDMINNTVTVNKRDYMSKTNFWIIIAFIVTGLWSLTTGLSDNLFGGSNIYLTYYGIFLISYIVFSTGIISYLINRNTEFLKTEKNSIEISSNFHYTLENIIPLFGHLFDILVNANISKLLLSLLIMGVIFIGIPAVALSLGDTLTMSTFLKWLFPLILTSVLIMTPITYLSIIPIKNAGDTSTELVQNNRV
jgi:hypothetical protein